MNYFPLPGIIDFLKKVMPFNTLGPKALNAVVAATMVAFYPAGKRIIRTGVNTPAAFSI